MPAKKKTLKKKTTANSKKLAELEKKNEELELSLNQLNEKYIKLLAEFDNYQRRTIQEKDKQRKFQSMDIIKDLLPVFDDIGRTIDSDDFKSEKKYLDPINMINSKIENTLKKHSISCFHSKGEAFDPMLHEALLDQESDLDKGIIINEYEAGYKYHDKIIRHAKVVVSKGKN